MTFTPTPKADLQTPEDLAVYLSSLVQQVVSRLHYAEQAADWAAGAIADLYGRLPGVSSTWVWTNTTSGFPGPGKVNIALTGGTGRKVSLSREDSQGAEPHLDLGPGATLVMTDDPATPPVTAFRQYVVSSEVADHGDWVSFTAVRVATYGVQDTPAVGAHVRLLLR